MNLHDVVSGGFCVGCGACTAAGDCSIRMQRTPEKTWIPALDDVPETTLAAADRICPFSDASPDETEIAEARYGETAPARTGEAGLHTALLAGRIADDTQVLGSSSGGLTSWFLHRLLARGDIDGVIHVGRVEGGDPLFAYMVSHSADELTGRRKSQYYAVEFSGALASVRGNGKRYAFVGVPCYVKAVRTLVREDPALEAQIPWCIGLVCGHMKSGAFPEVLSDQLGVPPDDIRQVDFRIKDPTRPANAYSFGVQRRRDGSWQKAVSREMVGGNWGHALFQLKACDFCDDIFAETADACFGDAWLPEYARDWRGTNAGGLRHPAAAAIFEQGRADGEIDIEDMSHDALVATQSGNFRHRREGLSYRLARALSRGEKVPEKRVEPGSLRPDRGRRRIIRIRQEMAAGSHVSYLRARQAGDMRIFYADMARFIARTRWAYRLAGGPGMLLRRILGRLARRR